MERHESRHFIYVKLGPPQPDEYSITDLPNATDEQVKIRQGWLNENQTATATGAPVDAAAGAIRKGASS